MNCDGGFVYILWSKARKYALYWLFDLQHQIIIIIGVGKTMKKKKKRIFPLMAPNEEQSKPQS